MSLLLLDTHAYAWAVLAPERLSERARREIADRANTLLVSAVSLWELAIKHRAGKWPDAEALLHHHEAVRARLGADDHPIAAVDAIRAGGLAWAHTDPFDRMLAVQAMSAQARLVTRDGSFAELPGLSLLW